MPDTCYLRVQAAVRAEAALRMEDEAALRAEDTSRAKPIGRYVRPQESAGSWYGSPHYARNVGTRDEQALMDEQVHTQEKMERGKEVGKNSLNTQ